jgi:hypothetical protein
MKALVVSDCATSAYVGGLKALFPDWDVRGVMRNLADQWVSANPPNAGFIEFLEDCDLHIGLPAQQGRYGKKLPTRARHIVIPSFWFRGLQPDCFHLSGIVSPLGKASDLHSRIVTAAFRAGLSCKQACDLFQPRTYEAFGYLTHYDLEKKRLVERFGRHGIDLSASIERWLGRGSFLYSYNHPRVDVLMEVLRRALIVADLLPAAERADVGDIGVADDLARLIVWPVYPEIAQRHGFAGSLLWRRGQSDHFQTLELPEFVAASFEKLAGKTLPELPELPSWIDRINAVAGHGGCRPAAVAGEPEPRTGGEAGPPDPAVACRRRAPSTPREIFDLFAFYRPETGLEGLFEAIDLAAVTPRQIYYAVHNRAPERIEYAVKRPDFSPLQRFVAALASKEFRANIVRSLLEAFPDRQRLLFIHIPRAGGSELSGRLMSRYPSLTSQLTWLDWVTPQEFYSAIRQFVLDAGTSDRVFVRGHNTLEQYRTWRAMRLRDSVFAVLREPVEMTVSQINYVLTRMFAARPGPDTAAWRQRFGVGATAGPPSSADVAALARKILYDKGVIQANTSCQYLGNGTAASAIENVVTHDVELTDFHRYEDWCRQRWGIDSQSRSNASRRYVKLEEFSSDERAYIGALTEEDATLYNLAQQAFAKRGGASIIGAEILFKYP